MKWLVMNIHCLSLTTFTWEGNPKPVVLVLIIKTGLALCGGVPLGLGH